MTQTLADRMMIRRCRGRAFATVFTLFVASFAFSARSTTAMTIEQQWECEANMVMEGSPMLADLDDDGDMEVLTAAYENMIAVDGTGRELWRFDSRGRYQVCPAILERGVDEEHIAFYPYDEPGGAGWNTVNAYIAFARKALAVRPGLKFYVNGGGDMPMLEALNEITSIWCPPSSMIFDDEPVSRFVRGAGKTLWSYDCGYGYARPVGWNTKTINIVGQYRMTAPFILNAGATGLGYWCYNIGESLWNPVDVEYPIVYLNPDGSSASSRRWEAVREGMEDARVLIALKERLADPSVGDDVKVRIRHLFDVTLSGQARQSIGEGQIGAARYILDATNNDAMVESFRRELLDCAEAVSGGNGLSARTGSGS